MGFWAVTSLEQMLFNIYRLSYNIHHLNKTALQLVMINHALIYTLDYDRTCVK